MTSVLHLSEVDVQGEKGGERRRVDISAWLHCYLIQIVCVCVCVCVCVHARTHVYICFIFVRQQVCVSVYLCVCVLGVCTYTYVCCMFIIQMSLEN